MVSRSQSPFLLRALSRRWPASPHFMQEEALSSKSSRQSAWLEPCEGIGRAPWGVKATFCAPSVPSNVLVPRRDLPGARSGGAGVLACVKWGTSTEHAGGNQVPGAFPGPASQKLSDWANPSRNVIQQTVEALPGAVLGVGRTQTRYHLCL